MKSRQVGYVLMALIVVGIAGLIARAVTSGSEGLILSGLLPLSQDAIDRVVILSTDDMKAELKKIGDTEDWQVGRHTTYPPKLGQFWDVVSDLEGAQLIATNPASHARMGVAKGQGTEVSFYRGQAISEKFVIGKWTPEIRLCYVKRSGKNEVYGIPCPVARIFDADPDGWRNPVILRVPRNVVESVTFTNPDEEFVLKISEGTWMVAAIGEREKPADLSEVLNILVVLENLPDTVGFASEAEASQLRFDASTPAIRVGTVSESGFPTTRLRFLKRDEETYWVKNPANPSVYILPGPVVDFLLKRKSDFLLGGGG